MPGAYPRDRGGGVIHPVAFSAGAVPCRSQMGLAGAGSDDGRLQHLRAVLPCPVRVTAAGHPSLGELLAASAFRRFSGVLHLVVELPDGSPGTIRADATGVLAAAEPGRPGRCWMPSGRGRCGVLVTAMDDAASPPLWRPARSGSEPAGRPRARTACDHLEAAIDLLRMRPGRYLRKDLGPREAARTWAWQPHAADQHQESLASRDSWCSITWTGGQLLRRRYSRCSRHGSLNPR